MLTRCVLSTTRPLFGGSVMAWSLGWFPDPGSEPSWLNNVPFEKIVFIFMTLVSLVTLAVSLTVPLSIEKRKEQ